MGKSILREVVIDREMCWEPSPSSFSAASRSVGGVPIGNPLSKKSFRVTFSESARFYFRRAAVGVGGET
jgi:hypothetical protein